VQRFGPLRIDTVARRVWLDGTELVLTRSEFALLAALCAHPGAAISNRDLLRMMWGQDWQSDTTPLQLHVSRLRRKLGESGVSPRYVVTIHGFGYRFEPDPDGLDDPARRDSDDLSDPAVDSRESSVTVLASPDRTILWVSDGVTTLLGWTAQDLIGIDGRTLVHPDDAMSQRAWSEIDVGRPLASQGRLRTSSGDYRQVSSTSRPVVDSTGSPSGILVVWRPHGAAPLEHEQGPIVLAPDTATGTRPVTLSFSPRWCCSTSPPGCPCSAGSPRRSSDGSSRPPASMSRPRARSRAPRSPRAPESSGEMWRCGRRTAAPSWPR